MRCVSCSVGIGGTADVAVESLVVAHPHGKVPGKASGCDKDRFSSNQSLPLVFINDADALDSSILKNQAFSFGVEQHLHAQIPGMAIEGAQIQHAVPFGSGRMRSFMLAGPGFKNLFLERDSKSGEPLESWVGIADKRSYQCRIVTICAGFKNLLLP